MNPAGLNEARVEARDGAGDVSVLHVREDPTKMIQRGLPYLVSASLTLRWCVALSASQRVTSVSGSKTLAANLFSLFSSKGHLLRLYGLAVALDACSKVGFELARRSAPPVLEFIGVPLSRREEVESG